MRCPDCQNEFEKTISTNLSPREEEIELLLVDGKNSKEIATVLGIATKTVEVHRYVIYRKRGVHSLAELLRNHYEKKLAALGPAPAAQEPAAAPAD